MNIYVFAEHELLLRNFSIIVTFKKGEIKNGQQAYRDGDGDGG